MESSRKKIVKKESWYSYITNLPSDLWLGLSEAYQVYCADFFTHDVQVVLSVVTGLFVNGILLWLRWCYLTEISSLKSHFSSNIAESLAINEEARVRIDRRFVLLSVPLLLWSVGNAIYVFTRFRCYNLFQANLDQLVDSSGFLKSSSLQYTNFQYPEVIEDDEKIIDSQSFSLGCWWSYFFKKSEPAEDSEEVAQTLVLYTWNGPFSPFTMNILCCFSPVHVILFLSSVNWQGFTTLILLHFGFTGLLSFLVWHFTQLLYDREILFSQVQHEHNLNLVYPQIHELESLKQLKDAYYSALVKARSREASLKRRFNIEDLDNFLDSKASSPSNSSDLS